MAYQPVPKKWQILVKKYNYRGDYELLLLFYLYIGNGKIF